MKYVFFGTPQFAITILDELVAAGMPPALVISSPDKPQGRKLILTPSAVTQWARTHGIPCLTPTKIRDEDFKAALRAVNADIFIVAAYGKIIPQDILDIPPHGTLNVHPSKLPLLRGPSPVESAILAGFTDTGVSIMKLDAEMDHGPILAYEDHENAWAPEDPPRGSELLNALAHRGGKLLARTIPEWIAGHITPKEQAHEKATFCAKTTKADGQIDILGDPLVAIRKIRAFDVWPSAFFFVKHAGRDIRVRITDAHIDADKLVIDRVIPEGKHEMNYQDFQRGLK